MAIVFSVLWLVFELLDLVPAASMKTVVSAVARYALGMIIGGYFFLCCISPGGAMPVDCQYRR